ncbi:hypothetical protein GCM10027446_25900 [Angustibacter peucedani]
MALAEDGGAHGDGFVDDGTGGPAPAVDGRGDVQDGDATDHRPDATEVGGGSHIPCGADLDPR